MEIVIIEKKAFEDFIQTVDYFISRITSMDARTEDKQPEQWLDTADVCAGLQLDRRTVYSLREQGKLPFSQFQHRVYYKAKDVKALADGLAEKSPKSKETEIVNPSK
ncbi:MAG: helix-turn-helix domain-containing protein [Prevotella sp.]|nr:helix-turn-helix domain-containing protein [Prevotella sp.]